MNAPDATAETPSSKSDLVAPDALTPFINHVLGQHPWARATLRAYAGRTLVVNIAPLVLHLGVTPEGLVAARFGRDAPESVSHQGFATPASSDVALTLALTSLPQFALDPAAALRSVRIEGDAEFAQVLGQLVRELRWDAEDDLARVFGDIAAHRLMRGAKAFHAYALDAAHRMAETASAFLIDEDPTLASRPLLDAWAGDVAALRDDCARLEKRLERLEATVPRQ